MKKTMLSAMVSVLAAGVLMGGCMADVGGESESEGVAAEGPDVGGGEEVGEAKQALTSLLLPLAANANFEFETGPNKDLYVIIKAETGSGMTEVHVLTAASNYTEFSVHTATALHATNTSWDFEIDKATGDLYALALNGTGSGRTEIHALSASSNWQTFTIHQPTAFDIYLPLSDFKWQLAANRDLFMIDKQGTSVHAARAANNWQDYNVHAVSALHPTSAAWDFELTPGRNLVALAKQGASGSTEVHSLSVDSNYKSFAFQTATELPPGDDAWQYDVTADCQLFGIKRWGTPSGQAELQITQLTGQVCASLGGGGDGGGPVGIAVIPNGSFENGLAPGSYREVSPGDTSSIPGWKADGNGIDYKGTYVQAFHGSRSIDLNRVDAGSIETTLATTPGTTYMITFEMAGNPFGGPAVKTMQVTADGTTPTNYSFDITGKSSSNMGWDTKTYTFTASSDLTVLKFTSTTPGNNGPAIDNVR